jgi:hypothetical protein
MNKEKQRKAIAEACGFKCSEDSDELGQLVAEFTPDYLKDLNAMHQAEGVLRDDREAAFRGWLWLAHGQPEMRCAIVHATAAQRAKAFLKTIGKWEEDE